MAKEAAPLVTALALGLVVLSPVSLTESDEDVPPSAQDPNAQPCGNSDNAEGAATISIPTVQAQWRRPLVPMIPPATEIFYIQRIFRN